MLTIGACLIILFCNYLATENLIGTGYYCAAVGLSRPHLAPYSILLPTSLIAHAVIPRTIACHGETLISQYDVRVGTLLEVLWP
jgi:hypothetical protein